MDIKDILTLQMIFSKTPDGRFIGKSLIPIIGNSLNNPEIAKAKIKMIKCGNCGLVIDEQYFSNGCKNCGSKDFQLNN